MSDQREDQGGTEGKEGSPYRSSGVPKRTPRMLHESSFATSSVTSMRSQSRPPGFVASSLDFKSNDSSGESAFNIVTTKPGRNKKKNKEELQQEQLEREKQYQQQRRYRSGQPTRARGNFGPPPHSVKSLEDLENMTEEQIYKLFMEDPDLHKAFMKATGMEEEKESASPSSAPVGAKNRRSSADRKPSKSKRKSAKTTTIKVDQGEREVPYFQWLFLFVLILAVLYKFRQSFNAVTTSKDLSRIPKSTVGRKQKKKGGGKSAKKPSTKKVISKAKEAPSLPREDAPMVVKKSLPKKKKKKYSKTKPTSVAASKSSEELPLENVAGQDSTESISNGKSNGNIHLEKIPVQKQDRQHEPDLDDTDQSSGKNDYEMTKSDLAIQMEPSITSSPVTNENDEAWTTVSKSSKMDKKTKTSIELKPVENEKTLDPKVENKGSEPKRESKTPDGDESTKKLRDDVEEEKPKQEETSSNKSVEEEKLKQELIPSNDAIEVGKPKQVKNTSLNDGFQERKTKKKRKKKTPVNGEKGNTNIASNAQVKAATEDKTSSVSDESKIVSDVKDSKTNDSSNKEKRAKNTEDDAALALQLHKEELNLAKNDSGNPQEEAWEEVTAKKKKK